MVGQTCHALFAGRETPCTGCPLAAAGYKLLDPGRYQVMNNDFSSQIAAFKDESFRTKLAADWDAPNTDSKRGSTLPPPRQTQVFVDKSKSNPGAEGKSVGEIAKAKGVHPATVMADLVVADHDPAPVPGRQRGGGATRASGYATSGGLLPITNLRPCGALQ